MSIVRRSRSGSLVREKRLLGRRLVTGFQGDPTADATGLAFPDTTDDRLLSRQSRSNHSQRIVGLLAEAVDLHRASFTLRPYLDRDRVSFASEVVDERHRPDHDHKDDQYHQAIRSTPLCSQALTGKGHLRFKPFRRDRSLGLLINRVRAIANETRPRPHRLYPSSLLPDILVDIIRFSWPPSAGCTATYLLIRGKVRSADGLARSGDRGDPDRRGEVLHRIRRRRDAARADVPGHLPEREHRCAVRRTPPGTRPEGLYPDRDAGTGRDAPPRAAPAADAIREATGEPPAAAPDDPLDRVLRRRLELVRLFGGADPLRRLDRLRQPVLLPPAPHDPRLPRDGPLPRRQEVQGPSLAPVLPAVAAAARHSRRVHQHARPNSESAGPPRHRRLWAARRLRDRDPRDARGPRPLDDVAVAAAQRCRRADPSVPVVQLPLALLPAARLVRHASPRLRGMGRPLRDGDQPPPGRTAR